MRVLGIGLLGVLMVLSGSMDELGSFVLDVLDKVSDIAIMTG